MPGHVELGGHPGGAAHQLLGARVGAHAQQQRFARLPDRHHRLVAPVLLHLVVDPVGGAAQRQFAQGDQVALAKEVAHRAFGLLRQVDLALLQALQQFVGRQVDHHDFVGVIEHAIRHGLPDAHSGDAAHDIVQAFQMLHVHCRPHVDAGIQQLFDVLPPFGVARPGHIGVRQFVDQDQLRRARQRRVEIELVQQPVAIPDVLQGQPLQIAEQGIGLGPAVGLDHADHHVHAVALQAARGRQHRVGLADTGAGADEDLEFAALGLGLLKFQASQQLVGVGSGVGHRRRRVNVPKSGPARG